VLDKSVLIAAPQDMFEKQPFSFLLPDILLQEIGTEKEEGCKDNCGSLNERRISSNLKKVMRKVGNTWVDSESAIRWELERGISASDKNAPCSNLSDEKKIMEIVSSKDLHHENMKYEDCSARLSSVAHSPKDEQSFQDIRQLKETEFFRLLRQIFSSPDLQKRITMEVKDIFEKIASKQGWHVSEQFNPDPTWLSYGMILSEMVFLPWKLWKYGDNPAGTRKPANPWFDMKYIAYMAIADGILSADIDQLKLAWACWPEKESSIYYFNTNDHEISQFHSKWS